MPLFTVVVPSYNRARMTAAAVLSVLAQTERDFECVVVDDGSTDGTAELLARLPEDRRLRVLRQPANRGQHACRNLAVRESSSRWITFLDSDDLYLPERLAAFAEAAKAGRAGFLFSNAYVRRWGLIVGRLFDPGAELPEGRVPGHLAVGTLPYVTSNVALRREDFERFGPFREDMRILEDTELYARMLAGGVEVAAIREPLAVRTVHEGQITRDHETDYREALMALSVSAPPEVFAVRRRELAVEVASYMLKGLRPREARAFLLRELGDGARAVDLYRNTFIPRPLLAAGRLARRLALSARSLLPEHARAARRVRPFLESAERL